MGFWKRHFSSKHLDSGDLFDGQKAAIKILSVGDCDEDETDGEKKMLITFQPGAEFGKTCKKRTWITSKTVGYQLEKMFGSDDAKWVNKIVVVYAAPIRDGEAIRVFGSPHITAECSVKVRDFGGKKTWKMVPTGKPPQQTKRTDDADEPPDSTDLDDQPPAVE